MGTPTPRDMEPMGLFKAPPAQRLHILWVQYAWFHCRRTPWIWRLWAPAEASRHARSMGQGSLAGISSQLRQPHDCPSLGTKPAQASGMCQQPRAPGPEGNGVGILFS